MRCYIIILLYYVDLTQPKHTAVFTNTLFPDLINTISIVSTGLVRYNYFITYSVGYTVTLAAVVRTKRFCLQGKCQAYIIVIGHYYYCASPEVFGNPTYCES